jgi:Holliday junction resolvase RusA-like endonuclease
MKLSFWVPGPLPAFNDIIAAAKGRGGMGYAYAKMKKAWTEKVAIHALAARIPKGRFKRVRLHLRWLEPPRLSSALERDPDNIEAGQKFVWDGLVHAKILPNDRRANNAGSVHTHDTGPMAGVEVTIEEV